MRLSSFDNMRLRNKLLILYFVCVFFPVILTNLLFYNVTMSHLSEQKKIDYSDDLERVKNEFRNKIYTAVGVSSIYSIDYMLYSLLDKRYSAPFEYLSDSNGYTQGAMNKFTPVYKEIQNITIYTDNRTMSSSGGISMISDEDKMSDWFTKAMHSKNSAPFLIRTGTSNSQLSTFSLIRRMNAYPDMDRQLKILKIDFNLGEIMSTFEDYAMGGNLYLLNDSGEIVFSTDRAPNLANKKVYFNKIDIPRQSFILEKEYDTVNYLNGWKIVGVFPKTSWFDLTKNSGGFFLYLILANFLVPTILILLIFRSLHTRIITLLKHMKMVKNQKFETIEHNRHKDEIGQLTEEFNRMTTNIKQLIENVYRAELQQKQAQLNALQSQINPHFLFNALETIRMRSVIKDEDETAQIIRNMAVIFRKSLVWKKDLVTVEEELELIECFLEIQKYRFEDKLSFDFQIDKEVLSYKIPKMCFLPFVENACIHGLESIRGKGWIKMQITCTGDMLTFQLSDNGIGIVPDKLSAILSYLEQEGMDKHVGIKNVFIRLKLYYQNNFQFNIKSDAGVGTNVCISIPVCEDQARALA
ncbi:histidine kinase [Neobacillus drentensis]|uniref:sensor histidine kinase n=1 Tax=Neobacillus drentensis TaxID=220684 RepID=UPI001F48404C|nr:sensor histidine kinase [Neobacillus drentensis]ULT56134.1 histidine kinase [Neobacillus drentensis]